jgi:hypothetical protein
VTKQSQDDAASDENDEREYEFWVTVPSWKLSDFIRGVREILGSEAIAEASLQSLDPRALKTKH